MKLQTFLFRRISTIRIKVSVKVSSRRLRYAPKFIVLTDKLCSFKVVNYSKLALVTSESLRRFFLLFNQLLKDNVK